MPRLSRTQKFADLHDQMINDKEEEINSHTLSSYQNRLDNVQNTLSPNQQQASAFGQPQFQQAPAFNQQQYQAPAFNQPSFQQNQFGMYNDQQAFAQSKAYVNEEVNNNSPEFNKPAYQQQAPIFGQQPQTPSFNNPQGPIFAQPQTTAFNQPSFQQADANVNNINNDNSYFSSFMANAEPAQPQQKLDFNSYFENVETVDKPSAEEIYANVFDDVKDNSEEVLSQKERDTYLNQTISDVNAHNIYNGQQTINSVVDSLVDEVRHAEEAPKQTNAFPWETNNKLDADAIDEPKNIDDDFSNTVSMEISKIMDEITNVQKQEEQVKPAFDFGNMPKQEEPSKPAFVAVDESKDVVEIKNIKEVENEQIKENTMSSTIPFIVAAEDEEVLDEDEEDGSNTVLNVILIVLIVVLIAVLGLIVFYILKTKGIF